MAALLAPNFLLDDRRQGVNAGRREGRDAEIGNLKVIATVIGCVSVTSSVIATRGEHLALRSLRFAGSHQDSELFYSDLIGVVEINADNQLAAHVAFDPADIGAAFAELDDRYLASEATAHRSAWSVIMDAFAAHNRHELPQTTTDFMSVDHRRVNAFAPGELLPYLRAGWTLEENLLYVEAAHRLSSLGAVCTYVGKGISPDGFDAQWRGVAVFTVDHDILSGCEIFDESDLDAALARFDELNRPVSQLANAASRVTDRFLERFAARDWNAMADMVLDDISFDDRRRGMNADLQTGRANFIENFRIAADLGATQSPIAIATRGERLVLVRARFSLGDGAPDEFGLDLLHVIEIDADHRTTATVTFDDDDFDAAIAELDARYLAGEAADHAQTWSVIAGAYAATNSRHMPDFAPDWASIDHRRARGFAPGDLATYIRATWELTPDITSYPESIHQLGIRGAVHTQAVSGTSQGGFDAEWREIILVTVEGRQIDRIELFDEADLDAALARFDELSRPTPHLENTASRVVDSLYRDIAAQNWDAVAETLAEDYVNEDRRCVVGGGLRQDRDAALASTRVIADLMFTTGSSRNIATRGERLVLRHARYTRQVDVADEFIVEIIGVAEINSANRIAALVVFEPDDIDAALAELDARYLTGEAAAYAEVWSAITEGHAALNRHELPQTTPDYVNMDHRPVVAFTPGELFPYVQTAWDVAPDLKVHIETVHRINNLGTVITQSAYGSSQEGFDAEWRHVALFSVDDVVSRCEIFDEADLDAALARFDELSSQTASLRNAASEVIARYFEQFAARDWDGLAKLMADDIRTDDRRRVANAGTRRGRDAEIANMRSVADIGNTYLASVVVAVRGTRLILTRVSGGPGEFLIELLSVVEINSDNQIAAIMLFDLDDIDSAFEELDARYLAGEATPNARTWSVIAAAQAAFKRHEIPAITPNMPYIDHRPVLSVDAVDLTSFVRAVWAVIPDPSVYIETVHRLSDRGAVVTQVLKGTSREDFDGEWRLIDLFTIEGDLISRCEVFDEADLDAAVARFDELGQQPPT